MVVEFLGREFGGTLVADCFTAYDHQALADWLQQKCVGHLLKDLSVMRQMKTRGAVRFAQDVTAMLRAALALRDQKPHLSAKAFRAQVAALEKRLDRLIDPQRKLTDPDNRRFAKWLRKQRPHLLRFLHADGLDPTNNQAERMLRPAVITRKTNGCNRTERGALAHAILASILVTCRQQDIPLIEGTGQNPARRQGECQLARLAAASGTRRTLNKYEKINRKATRTRPPPTSRLAPLASNTPRRSADARLAIITNQDSEHRQFLGLTHIRRRGVAVEAVPADWHYTPLSLVSVHLRPLRTGLWAIQLLPSPT